MNRASVFTDVVSVVLSSAFLDIIGFLFITFFSEFVSVSFSFLVIVPLIKVVLLVVTFADPRKHFLLSVARGN